LEKIEGRQVILPPFFFVYRPVMTSDENGAMATEYGLLVAMI
jgi:hypothetical protein